VNQYVNDNHSVGDVAADRIPPLPCSLDKPDEVKWILMRSDTAAEEVQYGRLSSVAK
jgi:hypothetical protein